ncbi:hypothetical protein PVAG01_06021 [Phlyctema vagabunda]|uniref:Uncharacterized protein n=1 Tax=Phlyctema vagabunda TaxID=108571 RepID=A0ABR4PF19_9HELO
MSFKRRGTAGSIGSVGSLPSKRGNDHMIMTHDEDEETGLMDAPPLYFEDGFSSPGSVQSPHGERFLVPTRTDSLSSGFPFPEKLYHFGVTNDEWFLFSTAIVNAAKTTFGDDFGAWSTAIAVGAVSCVGLLVLGPVAGYYAGKPLHRKAVAKKVREELMQDGQIRSILSQWNDGVFRQKGFQAWIELPRLNGEDLPDDPADAGMSKSERKKEANRFKILIIPDGCAGIAPGVAVRVPKLSDPPTPRKKLSVDVGTPFTPLHGQSPSLRRKDSDSPYTPLETPSPLLRRKDSEGPQDFYFTYDLSSASTASFSPEARASVIGDDTIYTNMLAELESASR